MLSVVHHPETPGSASKHSALGHSWTADRPNMLKRRKTEPDTFIVDKKPARDCTDFIENLHFNKEEVTLTIIPKNNNQGIMDLIHSKIKANPIGSNEEPSNEKTNDEITTTEKTSANMVISFFENSEEIQLTKIGSNENIKLISQKEANQDCLTKEAINSSHSSSERPDCSSEQNNSFLNSNSLVELSEVTIEPCSNLNKSLSLKSPSTSTPNDLKSKGHISKTRLKLNKAQEMLKDRERRDSRTYKKNSNIDSTDMDMTMSKRDIEDILYYTDKSAFSEPVPEQAFIRDFNHPNSPLFDEEQVPVSSVVDYEPFNVGIPCDRFYTNNRSKPYYASGFPNPPGENRCWTNATLQALFTLPVLNKLDSLNLPDCSKLMNALINVQMYWRKGNTGSHTFDHIFHTFKEELSALDKLYSSKAQQDVSEFVMNLLNFIKTEFASVMSKEAENNEIENIPNNEQDTPSRSQSSSTSDCNKRSPLADISASSGQTRNSQLITYNGQQDTANVKTSSSVTKSKSDSQVEVNINPIDKYFSLYMVENYICDGCSKQRQQKVENLILFIDLPSDDNGSTVNLVDTINKTYALEHRNMTCESCKHDMHSMITKFKKLPKILTVQVKRYEITNDGMITKKSTLVEVPKILRLDSLVINNSQEFSHFPEYEPVCIISHIGDNIDSGHYISFVKHEDQWFYYDDINVKLLSVDEVFKCIQNNAYVIFFQDTELSQNDDIVIEQKSKKESINC